MQVRQVPLRQELGQLMPPSSALVSRGSVAQASNCSPLGSMWAIKKSGDGFAWLKLRHQIF
jgi:hypothetical protein